MIEFKCRHCQNPMKASLEGGKITCGRCGEITNVKPISNSKNNKKVKDEYQGEQSEHLLDTIEEIRANRPPKRPTKPDSSDSFPNETIGGNYDKQIGFAMADLIIEVLFWIFLFSWEIKASNPNIGQKELGGLLLNLSLALLGTIVFRILLLCATLKDARHRGLGGAEMILIFVLVNFNGAVGWYIYNQMKPNGELVRCPDCRNPRLKFSQSCPHCGTIRPAQLGDGEA